MAAMHSYELKGNKLSFANWISNLSPTETPFSSMTGKEAVDQINFFWQNDRLSAAAAHDIAEGSDAGDAAMSTTNIHDNVTQILRRSVKVSDTANVMANYGRGRELAYQMEKMSHALRRDIEVTLLSAQEKSLGSATAPRKTAGFQSLVAAKATPDTDTGAIVHFVTGQVAANGFKLEDVQKMTYNLYLANSDADVIMFHPKHASFFALLQSHGSNTKMFDGDKSTFSHFVNQYTDEFGRTYKLIPNRYMPEDAVYFFKPTDFTQMVLRAPQKVKLGKEGNFEFWMIEAELGLRLRDPYAAGVLKLAAS